MNYQAVIFDLDGTLINSIDDIADAANFSLQKNNYPTHEYSKFKNFVGRGIRNLMKAALPLNSTDDVIDNCLQDFVSYYRQHCFDKTVLYDGIADMLDKLTEKNIKMAILSNKSQELTTYIVQKILSRWSFEFVFGASDQIKRKPNPEASLLIASLIGIIPQSILFVGDSQFDVQTAKAAGMSSVSVTWGFRNKEELKLTQPTFLIDLPKQLVSIIEE